jgi:regulator of RNase E activity RraA
MDVAPGEIIHMDENGACKFPADRLEVVLNNVRALRKEEAVRMDLLNKARTPEEVLDIVKQKPYGETSGDSKD